MCNRSAAAPKLWARHSIVNSLTLAALAFSFIAGLANTAPAILVYDRNAAVAYANANYNKVVSDGYFYATSYPATYYGPGQPVPAGVTGDDCAHFVSSVLGTPAGGLTIPNRAGTYGEPGAARLDELLVGNSLGGYGTTYKYGTLVSSVSQLTPGDVIGYNWDASSGGDMSTIDHTAVYIGNGQIDCHSNSRSGANWTLGGAGDYFFIHITLPDSIVPTAPSNVSPAASTVVSSFTPTLSANAFSDGAIGSTQIAAQWQVSNGSTVVYDSGTDTTHLRTLTVPAGKLSAGTSYTWRVRYEDNYSGWSAYSTSTSLMTTLPGDYNADGVVDTADYITWRNNPLQFGGSPDGYNTWRANLGNNTGSGTAIGSGLSTSAVPEPAVGALLIICSLCGVSFRRR